MKQREIKFRAWDKINKKMIYDFDGNDGFRIYPDGCVERFIFKIDGFMVDKELIVMQYTGLKDKNGKEIYEGDVVKWKQSEQKNQKRFFEQIAEVVYDGGGFVIGAMSLSECRSLTGVLTDLKRRFAESFYAIDFDFEVIGNIYENPELLNQPEKDGKEK